MNSYLSRTPIASRVGRFVVAVSVAACCVGAYAQQPLVGAAQPTLDLSHPSLSLEASLREPSFISTPDGYSSSATAALPADPGSPSPDLQPPPRRRRYGRPNYSDRYRNADGSNRLAFVVGGGLNIPVGSASSNFLNTGWRVEGGAGVNFSRKLGVLLQFDYDHFGIPGAVLQNQANLYNNLSGTTDYTGLGGNAHIWSFTLNPTINLYQGNSTGMYAIAGGGFYHKVTNFTIPVTVQGYDYFGFPVQYTANQVIDHYFSNAPGVTGGIGLTYKLSRWSNERLFAEARYVHTFNQARAGDPSATGASTGQVGNFYPPNSNETSYIPITFGIRF